MLRKTATIFTLLSLLTTPLFSEGTVSYTVNGEQRNLSGAVAGLVESGDKMRYILHVKDPVAGVYFSITVFIEKGEETSLLNLSNRSSEVMLLMKQAEGTLSIMPQIVMVKGEGIEYTPLNRRGSENSYRHRRDYEKRKKRFKPRWRNKTRSERIRDREGISVNPVMAESDLSIHLEPVINNNRVRAIQGTFSAAGTLKSAYGDSDIVINNGTFSMPVITERTQ